MTKAQEYAINRVRRMVEKNLGDRYEVKRFEVEENEYFVVLYVSVGMKNDEGTLAEVFARDNAQLFVGKRGGVTFPVVGKRGGYYRKTFHWYSILEASLAQR